MSMTIEEAQEEATRLFENIPGFNGIGIEAEETLVLLFTDNKWFHLIPSTLFDYKIEKRIYNPKLYSETNEKEAEVSGNI